MKANRHNYDYIFSVCDLYAAHGIFYSNKVVVVVVVISLFVPLEGNLASDLTNIQIL